MPNDLTTDRTHRRPTLAHHDRHGAPDRAVPDTAVPESAVPLERLADRYAVADLVTVLAGGSDRYADDPEGAALALFEGVVDVLLTEPVLTTTLVELDTDLRPVGLRRAAVPRRRQRVDARDAVRRLAAAFAPSVGVGETALHALADARAQVLAARAAG